MHISQIMDLNLLNKMIEERYIAVRKHNTLPLLIYNYTDLAQWKNEWNPCTRHCRGLITDKDGNIVAKPFEKFFNIEQLHDIPDEPYHLYHKMDGSLGIIFYYDNQWHIATRGNFHSEQAIKAMEILHKKYPTFFTNACKEFTYLVEIVYPENQIVLFYPNEELILLAVIYIEDNRELYLNEFRHLGLPLVQSYTYQDINVVQQMDIEGQEGVVIHWPKSNIRAKYKFENYKIKHKTVSGMTQLKIWECLVNGYSIYDLLTNLPDEMHQWVLDIVNTLNNAYNDIETSANQKLIHCIECYPDYVENKEHKKQIALMLQDYQHKGVCFNMLNKKPYQELIWKSLKP